jgi:hypothetical protein
MLKLRTRSNLRVPKEAKNILTKKLSKYDSVEQAIA